MEHERRPERVSQLCKHCFGAIATASFTEIPTSRGAGVQGRRAIFHTGCLPGDAESGGGSTGLGLA